MEDGALEEDSKEEENEEGGGGEIEGHVREGREGGDDL